MRSLSRHRKQRGSALVIIVTIIILLAVSGAIIYVLLNKQKGGSDALPSIGFKAITAKTPDDVITLLKSAKAGSYDAKCTYTDKTTGEGTLYIKGDKMRVDTTISQKPGHVLKLGDSTYIWADGQSEGSKFPVREENKDSIYSSDNFAAKAQEDNVVCQSVANLRDSLFVLPKSVNFVDVNSQIHTYSSSN